MKKELTRAIMAMSCLAILLTSMVPAYSQAHSERQPGPDPMEIYLQVGIDADQEAKIRSLVNKFEDDASKRSQEVFRLSKQIFELSMQPDPDGSAVMDAQAEINKIQNQSANEKLILLLKIRHVLKPDQKNKLVQIIRTRQQARAKTTN